MILLCRSTPRLSSRLCADRFAAIERGMLPHAPWQFGSILPWLDLFGIAVFATTGALAATRRGQTLVTAAFFALITGVGGGSVRDLLIGAPVFWVHDPLVAAVCLAVAGLVWITPQAW